MPARAPGKHALVFVTITVLLDVIGFALIIPVLPALLVSLTGATVARAAIDGGWLAFVYAAGQFLCAPVLGNLSDRFGRRPVLLFAVGALGIDYVIMGLAPTLGWLFLGRTISGIAGASFTPAYAYVADVSPPEGRARAFGMLGAAFGIGFILGPALGGLLGSFGPRTPFFAAAGIAGLNFIYGWLILPESLPPERRRRFDWRRANPLGMLAQLRSQRVVLGVLVALFLWMLANQVMPTTWSFFTKLRFGWSEALIGMSLAVAGLVMSGAQAGVLPLLVRRIGERRTALVAITGGTIGFVGYATATMGWMMFAWLGTQLFAALVWPVTNALMSRRVAPDAQGELQGAVASLYSLTSILGPPLMTQLFGHFADPRASLHVPGAAFLAAAALAATSGVILWGVTREPPAAGRPGPQRLGDRETDERETASQPAGA